MQTGQSSQEGERSRHQVPCNSGLPPLWANSALTDRTPAPRVRGSYAARHPSLTQVVYFQNTNDPNACACGSSPQPPKFGFPGRGLPPAALHNGGPFFPAPSTKEAFWPNTKDKLLWRKVMCLLKTWCGPQRPPLKENSHKGGVTLGDDWRFAQRVRFPHPRTPGFLRPHQCRLRYPKPLFAGCSQEGAATCFELGEKSSNVCGVPGSRGPVQSLVWRGAHPGANEQTDCCHWQVGTERASGGGLDIESAHR